MRGKHVTITLYNIELQSNGGIHIYHCFACNFVAGVVFLRSYEIHNIFILFCSSYSLPGNERTKREIYLHFSYVTDFIMYTRDRILISCEGKCVALGIFERRRGVGGWGGASLFGLSATRPAVFFGYPQIRLHVLES